jgi:hypothetical protein
LADWFEEHEAFKKKLNEKFAREAEGRPPTLADRARALIDAVRGRDGAQPAAPPKEQAPTPAREPPTKEPER